MQFPKRICVGRASCGERSRARSRGHERPREGSRAIVDGGGHETEAALRGAIEAAVADLSDRPGQEHRAMAWGKELREMAFEHQPAEGRECAGDRVGVYLA